MSFQAMTWAVEQELPAMQKIVLLMLANRTNHDTGLCFPSHDTLAKECGMSKSSVIRQIEALENGEFLKVVRTKKADGSNNPNHYRLKLNAVGSVTVKPPLVSERDHPSVTVTPEPEIKPITITTTIENENFLTFDGPPSDQIECYHWAKNHDYWNFATVSVHKFLTIYTKPICGNAPLSKWVDHAGMEKWWNENNPRAALVRAGIEDFRWHDLRHTWASWHIQSGTPINVLKELGGWSDLDMVLRYAHLSSEHLAQYANASKIETSTFTPPLLKLLSSK